MINLGDLVRDKITGYEGIVTSRTEFLNKCVRVGVQAKTMHENKPIDPQAFDEEQMDLLQAAAVLLPKEVRTGGPKDGAPRPQSAP